MAERGCGKKKVLVALLLLSLFVMTSQLIYSPSSNASLQNGSSNQSGEVGPINQLAADPSASPRPVNESAVGFDAAAGTGRTVNLPSSGTNDLPVTLSFGWAGTRLSTTVLGLWDKRQWAQGTGFTTGSGHSSPPWSYSERDPGNQDDGNWISGTPTAGQYVYGSLPHPGGTRTYYADEFSAWNETVAVNRGTVLDADLSLQYYPTYSTSFARGEFLVYAKVEGHLVWYTDFKTINDGGKLNKWTTVSKNVFQDVNGTNTFNMPADQSIQISIGVWYHAAQADYTFSASANRAYFDNVTLNIKTNVKAEQIQLKIREPTSGVSANIISPSFGSGSASLTGFTIGPAPLETTYYFDFTSNVTSPATGSFAANATIYVIRQKTAVTTFQNQGSNVEWSLSLVTAFQSSGQSFSTTSYTKYYFNISVPSDWSFTTCVDPSSKSHTISSEANNFTRFTVGSKAILRVNVTRIGSYSIPESFNPYLIHALSSNYVKNVFTQLKSGSVYTNATNFYPKETIRFASFISGALPVSTGIANFTIRGPPVYNASPAVIQTQNGVTPSSGWANFTETIPITYVAGNYSVEVDWVDNSLGEAGSLTNKFNVTHQFRVAVTIPGQGDVIVMPQVMGTAGNPPATVSVLDFFTNQSVVANVYASVAWRQGRWDKFTTFNPINGTYTNQTIVPSTLTEGHQYWLAANVTEGWYDKATANSTFWIGTGSTLNEYGQSISIYYTESPNFQVPLDLITYTKSGGGAITNATITLLAGVSSNQSIARWDVRFTPDTSHSGSGQYSGTVAVGTFSTNVKAIPPGSGGSSFTYSVVFRLFQGQYVQTQFFTLLLTVAPAPCTLAPYSGNGQSVWWGDTAQVKLNFTTSWTFGALSLQPTPIRNDSPYSPPYVTVATDWGGSWSVNHQVFDPNGIYTLYIDTTSFSNPSESGTLATIHVRFNKTYYLPFSGNLATLTLSIKSLTTRMTSVDPANTTTTYPGDLKTIFVWYNDTHTPGSSVGVGSASVTYTCSALGVTTPTALPGVAGVPGLYNLTLSGTVTDQIPGAYQILLHGQKGNFYVARDITETLNILPLTTVLQAYNSSTSVFYRDRAVFLIWFNDTHNVAPIGGATMSVTAPGVTLISPFEIQPGLWNLTIPTGQGVGVYSITIQANKTKYANGVETLTLDIRSLPTVFGSYVLSSTGSVLVSSNVTIPQNQALTIYLWFNDTNGVPIPGMNGSITYSSSEFGNGWVSATSTPGLYMKTFQTPDAGKFAVTFTVNAAGYQSHSFVFQVTVQAPPPGFSIVTLAIVGIGGGGIVVLAAAAMIFIRRARMPFVIKKINETLGLISKGQHEQATPVPLKSREEAIAAIMTERVESFTKRKPSKEEEAGEELAPTPAPSPETSEALKQELQAVEGKEKPEEGIEEVEMDTLDEQLQQLEKVESKENLPDGAKEVRDVIEKYKEGKKKKKET